MLGAHLAGEIYRLEEKRHLTQAVELTSLEFKAKFRLEVHIGSCQFSRFF